VATAVIVQSPRPATGSRAERWLLLVFLCGILEGAVRKWFLPEDPVEISYLAYLSKDIALAGLCVTCPAQTPGPLTKGFARFLGPGLLLLAAGAILSALIAVNWAGAFLTVRSLVVLPLLAYLAASRLYQVDATRIAGWITCLTLLPAGLGLVQFELPPDHVLNRYLGAGSADAVITDLGRVRATGTFSFISGMASMSLLVAWAGLFLQSTAGSRRHLYWLGLAGILSGLVCAAAAVSRSGAFLAIGLLLGGFLFSNFKSRLLVLLLIISAILVQVGSEDDGLSDPPAALATVVFQRHAQSDSILDRATGNFEQLSMAFQETPLGAGFGIGQVGGAAVAAGQRQLRAHEAEFARIITETGFLGIFGVLIIRLGVVLTLFSAWRHLPASADRTSVFISALAVLFFLVRNTAFDHVASGFTWPLVALSLAWADRRRAVLSS
jgi:hypothetical protein